MELGFLRPLGHPGGWASVYVDTSRATEYAPKRQALRRRVVGDRLTAQGADATTRDAVLDHLTNRPEERTPAGLAIFATGGKVVLDLPLTVAPTDIDICWTQLPHTTPLLELIGDEPPCLVAHLDHNGADLERRDGHGCEMSGRAAVGEPPERGHRAVPADRGEWHYRNRIENDGNRIAELIAAELVGHAPRADARLLVLAGDPRERAAVRERLPEPLRAVTVETGGGARLDREVEHAREEYARHHLDSVLDRFHAGRGRPGEHGARGPDTSPGVAAEGVPAVIEAAREHQISTLLVGGHGPDTHRDVWIGPDPDQIAASRGEVRSMGVRDPITARADDALLRCAAAADAEVLLVPDNVPGPAGGIGAVLRWRG